MDNQKKNKPKYDKRKFIAAFCVAMGLFAAIRHGFSINIPLHSAAEMEQAVVPDTAAYISDDTYSDLKEFAEDSIDEDTIETPEDSVEIDSIDISDDTSTDSTQTPTSQTQHNGHRIIGVHSWADAFPDIQDVQIVAAKRNGISPCSSREEAQQFIKRHKLVNISHSPLYVVDDLRHSMPYLVPKAQHMLNTICLNFIDSLQCKGLPMHLPVITSVLRTTDDVSRLQRGNGNATTNSCHCYGTTVDITYNRFIPLIGHHDPHNEPTRWNLPMKQVMAEVLRDLREQGACYVKYEYKQACFHLTVR